MILSHNNFQEVMAADMVLILSNDIYMRSVDFRNNNMEDHSIREFVKLLEINKSLTNLDLRENEGFT